MKTLMKFTTMLRQNDDSTDIGSLSSEENRAQYNEKIGPCVNYETKYLTATICRKQPSSYFMTIDGRRGDDTSDSSEMDYSGSSDTTDADSKENNTKHGGFWDSKDIFDHIRISADAPDLRDLVPRDPVEIKKYWWYYNQDDFKTLEESD
ncbi:uncharacterized protein LOC142986176 [Anticarsia gemmatalis]|uniref:uncharacterized protein LOC142986176 n=1 Tax=Anticarsia gemmatalis TaxID=129554 RepID=UPI003F77014F